MVNIPSSKTTGQRFWVRPALCPQAARHWVTSLRMWLLTGNITSLQTIIKLVAIHLLISSGTTLSEYTIQYNTVQYSTIQYNTYIYMHCPPVFNSCNAFTKVRDRHGPEWDLQNACICRKPSCAGSDAVKKRQIPHPKGAGWALGAQNLTVRKCMMRSCTASLFSTHATPLQRYGTDMAQNGICKTPASVVNRAAQGQMQSKKGKSPIHF